VEVEELGMVAEVGTMEVEEAEAVVGTGLSNGGGDSVCREGIDITCAEVFISSSETLWRGAGEGNEADLGGSSMCALVCDGSVTDVCARAEDFPTLRTR